MPRHDLHDFFEQASAEMAAEYQRIRKKHKNDHGTAGDEGEENWAELLSRWLPAGYHVVTKGQIMGSDGSTSPQIDILVLSSAYPPFLTTKRMWLADGVIAAFECKNTLKATHLIEAAKTAAAVRKLTTQQEGTPYDELLGTPLYGVLAHAHSWESDDTEVVETIEKALQSGMNAAAHPRDLLDLVCVANLSTWWAARIPWLGEGPSLNVEGLPPKPPGPGLVWQRVGEYNPEQPDGAVVSSLNRHTGGASPLLSMMTTLLRRLAWHDPQLQPIARTFESVDPTRGGGPCRNWNPDVYSDHTWRAITQNRIDGLDWTPWAAMLM
ncbi:DUF6602 domain-containing protein [Streptodolium elevatio]|uniref:DUF6602 domain-containing protein n=1 Tax=Streptodolium elevatio TaxID=3157996 RepID=A0ABV3DDE5_9ACTN